MFFFNLFMTGQSLTPLLIGFRQNNNSIIYCVIPFHVIPGRQKVYHDICHANEFTFISLSVCKL